MSFIVTPQSWYMAFWAGVWLVTMVTLYFIVRYAVRWGVGGDRTRDER